MAKDLAGSELAVGDFIAYGGRAGNMGFVRLAKILEISEDRMPSWSKNIIYNEFKIQAVEEEWGGKIRLLKESKISDNSRIIKLSKESLGKFAEALK